MKTSRAFLLGLGDEMKGIKRCTIRGCKRWHHAKGLCAFHYEQNRKRSAKRRALEALQDYLKVSPGKESI